MYILILLSGEAGSCGNVVKVWVEVHGCFLVFQGSVWHIFLMPGGAVGFVLLYI